MCEYQSSRYALPHWKCVLRCCAHFPWIDLPSPESDQHNYNFIQTIFFHLYQHSLLFTVHGGRPFNEKKHCQLCETTTD